MWSIDEENWQFERSLEFKLLADMHKKEALRMRYKLLGLLQDLFSMKFQWKSRLLPFHNQVMQLHKIIQRELFRSRLKTLDKDKIRKIIEIIICELIIAIKDPKKKLCTDDLQQPEDLCLAKLLLSLWVCICAEATSAASCVSR